MLSRVAERLYWMARYIERAENTARLVNVYANLMLDLPRGVGIEWKQLIEITGSTSQYRLRTFGEQRVVKFMLSDRNNPSSIFSSIAAARENVRTTRDLVPSEGWEHVNELYLFARKKLEQKNPRKNLYQVLSDVVMRCQQITGLLAGTMSHGDAYQFVRLGRNLERADMTSRILDVGSATLIAPGAAELQRLENRLWTNILRAMSAHQMYRQTVRRGVRGKDVVSFLVHDTRFPRAIAHCLQEIRGCLETLPRHEAATELVIAIRERKAETDVAELLDNGLQRFMDDLQRDFSTLHNAIYETWFAPQRK